MTAARPVLVWVFITGVVVRLGVAVTTGALWRPELWEYNDIARSLVEGRGFTYPFHGITYYSYAPPLHSWLSAASYWLVGGLWPLMMWQCAAGGALAVVSAMLAGRMSGDRIAMVAAGAAVALHPGLVVYAATKAHPMIFDALFFCGAALMVLVLRDQPTLLRAVGLGLCVGVGAHSRSTVVMILPAAAIWWFWSARRHEWLRIAGQLVVAGLVTIAVLTPWAVRNYRIHDRFVFMVTTDGEVLWRGNNPFATGHSYAADGRLVIETLTPAEQQQLRSLPTEMDQSDWFKARARAFMQEKPTDFLTLTLAKFGRFWWFSPNTGVRYPASWFWGSAAVYVASLLAAAAGLWSLWRGSSAALRTALWLGAVMVTVSGLQSLYYIEGRHRWALEPLLLSIAGVGVAAMWSRSRRAA